MMLIWICTILMGDPSEANEVRQHIRAHYIDAMYTAHDAAALRAGFHPQFRMIIWWDKVLSVGQRDTWIDKVMSHPAPNAEKAASVRAVLPVVWVAGNAAAARIEIYRDDVHRYTDFFTLYRIDGKWQVFAKSFHYHENTEAMPPQPEADRAAIENLIEARYLAGFARGFSAENIRKGFHEQFRMVTWWKDKLTLKDRETWIGKLISNSGATPEHRAQWSWRIPAIEVAGDAALARIELSHGGHLMFTDFFLLYRFDHGWQVVEKSFDYRPKKKEPTQH